MTQQAARLFRQCVYGHQSWRAESGTRHAPFAHPLHCNQHISSHQSNNCWLKLPICCIRHLYHALGCTIPVRSPATGSFTGKISWHAQDFSATLRIYQCSQDVCPPQDFSNPLRIFQRPQDVLPSSEFLSALRLSWLRQDFLARSGFLGYPEDFLAIP